MFHFKHSLDGAKQVSVGSIQCVQTGAGSPLCKGQFLRVKAD